MTTYQDEWLERIENKLDVIRDQTAKIEPLREQFNAHVAEDKLLFHGNGSPGLIKEVDRLKQLRKGLAWLIGLIVVGAASSTAELIKAAMAMLR